MRITAHRGDDERVVVAAMATDKAVLGAVAPAAAKHGAQLWRSRWAAIVANWCLEHYNKYGQAPGKALQQVYEEWAVHADPNQAADVENWLYGIAQEWGNGEGYGSEYAIDVAAAYFKRNRLAALADAIQQGLDNGNLTAAQEALEDHQHIELGTGGVVDPFLDHNALYLAGGNEVEQLVEYPGPAGQFFRGQLVRDGFVAFLAPEKRGKTFWLADLTVRAMQQRRRVLFFQAGDMSQNQFMRRLMLRAYGKPLHPCTYLYPTKFAREGDENELKLEHEERHQFEEVGWQSVWQRMQQIQKRRVRSTASYFKLATYPSHTLSVGEINTVAQRYVDSGWVPDVIAIDYADILDMPGADRDPRQATNKCWSSLRRLSQELHCLVVTATQANSASYKSKRLTKSNFSEDKRKIAHVTGMVGINVEGNLRTGNYLLNWVAVREGIEGMTVRTAPCLDVANPIVRSCV